MRVGVVIFLCFFICIFCAAQKTEIAPPIFSINGGIYKKPQKFSIKSTHKNATIYFTVNGTIPSKKSKVYKKTLIAKKTATIKARVFLNDEWSTTITQTFIIKRNYSLPVVSLTTDPKNLWNKRTGIYVRGMGKDSVYPYDDANFWEDWEVEVNFEFFDTKGKQQVNQRAGMKIFGGWSRPMPQKSVAIYGRKKYGNKYFRYNFFPERSFKNIKLLF